MTQPETSDSGARTWRDEAVAVVIRRLRGPLRPKGQPLASEQAVRALAQSIVDSLPPRIRRAEEGARLPPVDSLDDRFPHYYIEVESETDTTSRVHDLNDPAEPCVFGPCTYQEARAWCVEHGDPEAAE